MTKNDTSILGDTILERWGIEGQGCGSMALILAGTSYPRHQFSAIVGLELVQEPTTIARMRSVAVNTAGKTLNRFTQTVRYGYGRGQLLHLSLPAGTSKLVITWANPLLVVVYGMALS